MNLMVFEAQFRVYYEDTDSGGVVYYANYLKFIERCRTEWLRSLGYDQSALSAQHQLVFMVRSVEGDFLRPAILDDLLTVDLRVEKLGRSQLVFLQNVMRKKGDNAGGDSEILFSARVRIACVSTVTMKPVSIPVWMKEKLHSIL